MRYSGKSCLALKGTDLDIRAGERIGIVGRTGSGKSSLLRVFLRLNKCEENSKIMIDDIDICRLDLKLYRSTISVIPQNPVLFSGSVRFNLDPFESCTDDQIWVALEKAHISDYIHSLQGQLDYEIEENGENFSSGQKQLLCIARTLLRKKKVVVLDEATSSVDTHTDSLIQKTIREEFGDGKSTMLIIAHRLNTIIDADKVVVMNDGNIEEFDSPNLLLQNKNSVFSKMMSAESIGNHSK